MRLHTILSCDRCCIQRCKRVHSLDPCLARGVANITRKVAYKWSRRADLTNVAGHRISVFTFGVNVSTRDCRVGSKTKHEQKKGTGIGGAAALVYHFPGAQQLLVLVRRAESKNSGYH